MIPIQKVKEMSDKFINRYEFAMSSFARLYGVKGTYSLTVKNFCREWANSSVAISYETLDDVDAYFSTLLKM
jgi:hypothetical protein